MASEEYKLERPKQRNIKDGINDHLRNTIHDEYPYPGGKTLPYKGERDKAYTNKLSKPSRRLNAKGQDYVTRDKEHMGRNPDGSKRIIPKNKSSMVRPS